MLYAWRLDVLDEERFMVVLGGDRQKPLSRPAVTKQPIVTAFHEKATEK
jgi:hypothetical protein